MKKSLPLIVIATIILIAIVGFIFMRPTPKVSPSLAIKSETKDNKAVPEMQIDQNKTYTAISRA